MVEPINQESNVNKRYLIIIGCLLLLQFVLCVKLASESGKNQSLQDQKMVLMNLACSLDSGEFKSTLDALSPPEEFKKGLGENYATAWAVYKEQLYFTCYDEPAS